VNKTLTGNNNEINWCFVNSEMESSLLTCRHALTFYTQLHNSMKISLSETPLGTYRTTRLSADLTRDWNKSI